MVSPPVASLVCEACGAPVGRGLELQRRTHCAHCGALVCRFCYGRGHRRSPFHRPCEPLPLLEGRAA